MPGLGIVPYFIWNATSNATNTFYGANFVDYIGLVGQNNDKGFADDVKLTLVRPTNATGYDTFIFKQYFDVILDAKAAPEDATLAVIEAIGKLPASKDVKLKDSAAISAARSAYDKLSLEQRTLVTNFSILTAAEQKIALLESLQKPSDSTPSIPGGDQGGNLAPENPDPIQPPVQVEDDKTLSGTTIALIAVSAGAAIALALFVIMTVLLVKTKRRKKKVKLMFGGKTE